MTYWLRQLFTRPREHFSSLIEVFVTAVFALLPLALAAIKYNYEKAGDNFVFDQIVRQAFGGGQLFLYSYALIGTIIWLSLVKWDRPATAPRRFFGFITIIGSLTLVYLLAIDPTLSSAKNYLIIEARYWAYASFLLINYLLLFYMNIDPPTPEDSLAAGTSRLIKTYRAQKDDAHGN